VKIKR